MFVSDVQPRGLLYILHCLIRAFTRRTLPDVVIPVPSLLLLFVQLCTVSCSPRKHRNIANYLLLFWLLYTEDNLK